MDKEKNSSDMMMEPAVVPTDLQPSPPSKAESVHSGEQLDVEKKYETIQTIKMNDNTASNPKDNMKSTTMEKPISIMNSSLNLLSNQEIQNEEALSRKGVSANTKLGIIQLVLSVLLSAFGGLLLARNASLSIMGSGIWAGIFAGVCGALGLMNVKPLLNGFLACSLISVATSTLALALTGIGLVRDYNISQQDPEFESAVMAACGLTILLILHLLTSMFSVYYSALELCSK
ncbi:hypothetical protein PVAND_012910 [Polypedilum vanderplanki]|uniref:Uncharacterized protein n=1 Tax=Polypedilum vanderplanki TaxID=319348 RepID=A0A9J6CP49_POLVA|nr:hypothetical protein PVAND_012910 [Polypedilum vanderplanki]